MVTTGVLASISAFRLGSVSALAAGAAGGAEGDELGVLEVQLGGAGEELDVLGVGAGPAAFDVVDAELVQLARDLSLSSTESEMPSIWAPSRRVVS